jgi:hypothetical protein
MKKLDVGAEFAWALKMTPVRLGATATGSKVMPVILGVMETELKITSVRLGAMVNNYKGGSPGCIELCCTGAKIFQTPALLTLRNRQCSFFCIFFASSSLFSFNRQ